MIAQSQRSHFFHAQTDHPVCPIEQAPRPSSKILSNSAKATSTTQNLYSPNSVKSATVIRSVTIRNLDLTSLEKLNQQFTQWVEHDYNATVHSTLGMKPIDRFGMDLSRIRFLSPSQDTDELFYAEAIRSVKKDNTFSFQGQRYETPIDARGKKITLRYERHRQGIVVVYENERRIGKARLLDAVANGMKRRPDA